MYIENISLREATQELHRNPGHNSMLICINNEEDENTNPPYQFKHISRYIFLDLEDGDEFVEEKGFQREHAIAIIDDLILAKESGMNVLVHCTAGLCRSGAVVEAGILLGFADTGRDRIPNIRVKNMLIDELIERNLV